MVCKMIKINHIIATPKTLKYYAATGISQLQTTSNNVEPMSVKFEDIFCKPIKNLVSIVNENKHNKYKFNLSIFKDKIYHNSK